MEIQSDETSGVSLNDRTPTSSSSPAVQRRRRRTGTPDSNLEDTDFDLSSGASFDFNGSSIGHFIGVANFNVHHSTSTLGAIPEDKLVANIVLNLREDFKISCSLEQHIDSLEDANFVDCQILKERLRQLLEPNSTTLNDGDDGDDDQSMMRFSLSLRWRHDHYDKILDVIKTLHSEQTRNATLPNNTASIHSTRRNIPRLRLALRQLGNDIGRLPARMIEALCLTGCLTTPEGSRITRGEAELMKILIDKRENALRKFRCLLLRHFPDIHENLLRIYLTIDLKCDNSYFTDVPQLPVPYVRRVQHEEVIKKWLITEGCCYRVDTMLLIHGMGSVGKTSLAIYAAYEALSSGFHRVVWLSGSKLHPKKSEDLFKQVGDLQYADERVLVIIDDVTNDQILEYATCPLTVIATSRLQNIGEHNNRGFQRKKLPVSGLSNKEAEDLLMCILYCNNGNSTEAINHLRKNPNLFGRVRKLFENGYYMPLMVNIVASMLSKDQERWLDQGMTYMENLEKEFSHSKSKVRNSLLQHSHTSYSHASIYEAIYVSIERLSDKNRQNYEMLSIYDHGERIQPISMSTIWDTDETSAERRLVFFAKCSILTELGYHKVSKQKEFMLHSLMIDVLKTMLTEEKRRNMEKTAIELYCRQNASGFKFESVDPRDTFFHSHFVRLCLKFDKVDMAVRCMCRIPYCMTRIQHHLGDGMMEELNTIVRKLPNDETVRSYGLFLEIALSRAIEYNDPSILLRVSLARRHQEDIYEVSKGIIAKNETQTQMSFFELDRLHYRGRPFIENSQFVIERIKGIESKSVLSIDVAEGTPNVLVSCTVVADGRTWYKVLLFRHPVSVSGDHEVVCELVYPTCVRLARLLSDSSSSVLIVTQNAWSVYSPQRRKSMLMGNCCVSRQSPPQVKLQKLCGSIIDGECVTALLAEKYLWLLIIRSMEDSKYNVHCYAASENGLEIVRRFSCYGASCERLVVSQCGQMAAVSSSRRSDETVEVFSRDWSQSRRLKRGWRVVGFLHDATRVLLLLSLDFCWQVVAVGRQSESSSEDVKEISSALFSFTRSYEIFTIADTIVLLDCTTGRCKRYIGDVYKEHEMVDLKAWPADATEILRDGNRLFVCKENDRKTIITYPLSDLCQRTLLRDCVTGDLVPTDARRIDRQILLMQWVKSLGDIIIVCLNRKSQLSVRGLIYRQDQLDAGPESVVPHSDSKHHRSLLVSVSGKSVAAAEKGGTFVFVCNFQGIEKHRIRRFASGYRVIDHCYSVDGENLFVLIKSERESTLDNCRYYLHRPSAESSVPLASTSPIVMDSKASQKRRMLVFEESQSIIIWSDRRLLIYSFSGDLVWEVVENIQCHYSIGEKQRLIVRMKMVSRLTTGVYQKRGKSMRSRLSEHTKESQTSNNNNFADSLPLRASCVNDWSLLVYDLSKKSRMFTYRGMGIRSAVFSACGLKLAFLTTNDTFNIAVEGDYRMRVVISCNLNTRNLTLMSFDSDKETVLLKDKGGNLFLFRSSDFQKTLAWSWQWIDKRWGWNINSCVTNPLGNYIAFTGSSGVNSDSNGAKSVVLLEKL